MRVIDFGDSTVQIRVKISSRPFGGRRTFSSLKRNSSTQEAALFEACEF